MPTRADIPHHRLSASLLPPEVEPEERDFMRLLEKALAPSYTLVKRVGAGGMGAVYLARDPVLKRLVAVKVMSPALAADPTARVRFEREAQSVAAISHPNVVSVYSVGELENGVPYLVMQYIEGQSMAERLQKDGPLEARAAKRVLGEVASALAAAHRKGVIHRDIKPSNILWDDDTGRAMVTDFGIAAVLERGDERAAEREAVQITHTGMAVGTPAYMSPEQLLAEPVTEKTDVYSLGLLGYQLFIADGPYQISSPRELMAAHLRDTPRKLSTMRADIDPELERLLENCLAKDPAKRPSSAEVEKRLAHGASVLLEWPPPGAELIASQLRLAVRITTIGAFAFGVPTVSLSVFNQQSFIREVLPPPLVLIAVAAIGFLVFFLGLEAYRRFLVAARKLVASGYGWGTVMEVVSDERGDTGTLIAGGREYAELLAPERSAMRRTRAIATVLRVLASIVPVLGYGIGLLLGGPLVVLGTSILLSIALLLASSTLGWREDHAMRPARQRIRTAAKRAEGVSQLAQSWTQTFEQVRVGQPMGSGSPKYARFVRPLMIALLVGLIVEGVIMLVVLMLTTGMSTLASIAVPKFSSVQVKADRVRRLEAYRIRPDSSITALRAGQALHAIIRNGPSDRLQAFEKQPVITIPPQTGAKAGIDPFDPSEGGFQVSAFRQALRGFTIAQRDFLRAMADNTALEEFRILARAPSLDFPAAYWDIRPGAIPTWGQMPLPKYAPLAAAANANIAQAALDFAAGRRQEAEQRLRENISAGFLITDNARFIIESHTGTSIVTRARAALGAFFEGTGRAPEAKSISAERDPVITVVEPAVDRNRTLDELNAEVNRLILNDAALPGLRWEMLMGWFVFVPCPDMHQVLFGADAQHRAVLEEARAKLVKRQSDSLLFRVVENSSDPPRQSAAPVGQFDWERHRPVARIVSALTGNRQLEACLGLMP